MADWKKLLVENPPASDIASSPSSGKVLKVSSNGTGLEWADDAGGAFSDNGSTATVTDRIVTIAGSSSAIPTLDINPPFSVSGTSYSRIRVQTSGRDLRFNLRNGMSTSDVMTIGHNNKVGIGTSSPSKNLHVAGTGEQNIFLQSTSGNSRVQLEGTTFADIIMTDTGGGSNAKKIQIRQGDDSFKIRTLTDAGDVNNEMIHLDIPNNRVGIGTTSVDRTLHVKGANHQLLKLESSDSTHIDIQAGSGMGSGNAYIQKYAADGTEINRIFLGNSTDFYSKGSGGTNFYVSSNNTQALTIKNNANIGIGTNAPSHKFHINHSSSTSLGLYVAHSADQYGSLAKFYTNSSNNTARNLVEIHNDNASSTAIIPLKITQDANGTALAITNGKVGIGTSSPSTSLEISGGSSKAIIVDSTSGVSYITARKDGNQLMIGADGTSGFIKYGNTNTSLARDLRFFEGGGSETMRLTDAGRLGIGTSAPNSNSILHIVDGAGTMPTTHAGDSLIVQNNANTTDVSAIYAIAGTAGSSHIVFGDADSKNPGRVSYYHNSDYMSFHTNTTEQMRISSAGNVGIGTTSPLQPLHIESNNNNSDASVIIKNHNADGTCGISFRSGSANNISIGIEKIGSNFAIQTGVGLGSGTRLFTVTPNGSVGIGTSSPSGAKLHVYDASSSVGLKVERGNGSLGLVSAGGSTTFFGTGDATDVEIGTNSSTLMFFDHSNSNIGIGTSSPSDKLHVADTGTDSDGRIRSSSQNVTSSIGSAEGDNRYFFAGAGLEIMTNTNHDIRFGTNVTAGNATPKMVLDTSGRLGIGTSSPTEKLQVAGNILLPTNASSLSYKLRLTGDSTHEIYSDSYTLRYDANVGHRWNSAGGNTMTGGAGTIEIKHSTNQKYIRPGFAGFHLQASHDGGFGFVTVGSTSTYTAIEPVYTDNNTSGLKFNSRASGSKTERMRITSAGNVGIGTTSPSTSLDVNGNIKAGGTSRVYFNTNATGIGSTTVNELDVFSFGNMDISTENLSTSINFKPVGTTVGTFTATGLGIGTTSPNYGLHIDNKRLVVDYTGIGFGHRDNSNNQFRIFTNISNGVGELYIRNASDANQVFFTGNGNSYFNGGRLGIGTTSPSAQLHVAGEILTTGNFTVQKSFPDIALRADNEQRLNYMDNGGAIQSGIKNNSGTMKFYGSSSSSSFRLILDSNSRISLSNNDSGTENTVFGYTAGSNIDAGSNYNVYIGHQTAAGGTHDDAVMNTGVGYRAMYPLTSGDYNTALGSDSLRNITTGSHNTGIGSQSLYSITTGFANVAIGKQSLNSLLTGTLNVAIGNSALYSETGADTTVAIGQTALYSQNMTSGTDSNNVGIGYLTSYYNVTGRYNTAIGASALKGASGQSHSENTAIGASSMLSVTTGHANSALGHNSLYSITTGQKNISIGKSNSFSLTTGGKNVSIGTDAGKQNETGNFNVSIGNQAMQGISGESHSNNIAIGYQSMLGVTTSSENVAIGSNSLQSATTGNKNIAIGYQTLRYNVTGAHNIALGHEALEGSSGNSYSHNTAIGVATLKAITTGGQNVAVGNYAGDALTTGGSNVVVGYNAFSSATDNFGNVAIGEEAFAYANSGESYNIGIGYRAGHGIDNSLSDHSILIGRNAGVGGSGKMDACVVIGGYALDATGANNKTGEIAIGYESLTGATTGYGNLAIGHRTSKSLTTGNFNTSIGYESGRNQTTASNNTFIGYQSGRQTTGSSNVAIGKYTMYEGQGADANTAIGTNALQNITGDNNVAIGSDSLTAQTSGSDNTSVGAGAGLSVTTGYDNTLLGKFAGKGLTTGDGNTLIGDGAGDEITTGRRNTVIGKGASTSGNDALDQIVIGWGATGVGDTSAMIGGSQVTDVYMGDNGSSWSTTSDGRLKENIEEWTTGLDAINKLRIVEYNFKEDNPYNYNHEKKRQGIIAQEAIEAIPEMIKDDGEWLSANQEPMIWALVNAVQELTKKVNELETKLNKEN